MPDALNDPAIVIDHFPAARRSLRLAVVTETWPPEVNGVATSIARVVQGLQQRNHDVQLVRPRQSLERSGATAGEVPGLHEVLMRGLPIPRYPHLRMGVPSKRHLLRLWQQQRPDVVHVATEGPLGWSAVQAATALRLPVTSDFRTNFHAYSQHYGIGWLRRPILGYLRKFHNRCAVTMAPTDRLRGELGQAGFQRVVTLPRGVDTRAFGPAWRSGALRAQWGVGDGDLVVACVGRLAPEKNLGLLERAFAQIRQRRPDARLLLVGDGPLRAELQRRLPQAILAGQQRGQDLAAHYASADLFVFPSMTETFGNVTSEAMASALAVVAYDHAGAAHLIRDGHNGRLAPLGDEAAFVQAAVQMATDDAGRLAVARAARERALAQDWSDIVARFEQVLRSATGADAALSPALGPIASAA